MEKTADIHTPQNKKKVRGGKPKKSVLVPENKPLLEEKWEEVFQDNQCQFERVVMRTRVSLENFINRVKQLGGDSSTGEYGWWRPALITCQKIAGSAFCEEGCYRAILKFVFYSHLLSCRFIRDSICCKSIYLSCFVVRTRLLGDEIKQALFRLRASKRVPSIFSVHPIAKYIIQTMGWEHFYKYTPKGTYTGYVMRAHKYLKLRVLHYRVILKTVLLIIGLIIGKTKFVQKRESWL